MNQKERESLVHNSHTCQKFVETNCGCLEVSYAKHKSHSTVRAQETSDCLRYFIYNYNRRISKIGI